MRAYIIERCIRGLEGVLGVRLEYLRWLGRVRPGVLPRIGFFLPLSGYRKSVPAEVLNAARIAATVARDCGECLQIAVNVANQEGVAPDLVQAIVRRQLDMLPPDVVGAYRFAEEVSADRPAVEEREAVRRRFGDEGLAEISTAVAAAQFFPVLKRGLGFSQSCSVEALEFAHV